MLGQRLHAQHVADEEERRHEELVDQEGEDPLPP
jgi:hypothetical protein